MKSTSTGGRSRFTHSIIFHANFDKHSVSFDVLSIIDVLVRSKFRRAKAGVFAGLGSAKKRLVFRTDVRFDCKRDVLSFGKVCVLIQQIKRGAISERPG